MSNKNDPAELLAMLGISVHAHSPSPTLMNDFVVSDKEEHPLAGWAPPGGVRKFLDESFGMSPQASLSRARQMLCASVFQEELDHDVLKGFTGTMVSLATGDGWIDESGNGGFLSDDGTGSLPYALAWSLFICADAYRSCVAKGDLKMAASVLPWYARSLVLLKLCCPPSSSADEAE